MIDEFVTEASENNESVAELESEAESITESETELEENESGNVNYIMLEAPTIETVDYSDLLNTLIDEQSSMYELVSAEYVKQYDLLNESSHNLAVSVTAVRVIMVVLLLAWLYLLCGKGRKH